MSPANKEWFDESSASDCEKPVAPEAGLRVIERLTGEGSVFELEPISEALRSILRYRYFACALVRVYDARIMRVVNLDFPSECLEAMKFLAGSNACPLVKRWLSIRAPMIARDLSGEVEPAPAEASPASQSHAGALAVHAQLDSTGTHGLLFCFDGVAASSRIVESLRYLTPSLFSAFAKIFWAPAKTVDCRELTSREIEVLEWMHCGKRNDEIACMLNISIYTVKNHVQKILLKLSATNRTQAVLRAVEAGVVRGRNPGAQPPPEGKRPAWAH